MLGSRHLPLGDNTPFGGPGGPAIAFNRWLLVHRFFSLVIFSVSIARATRRATQCILYRAVSVAFILQGRERHHTF